jgi:hypothetical protein
MSFRVKLRIKSLKPWWPMTPDAEALRLDAQKKAYIDALRQHQQPGNVTVRYPNPQTWTATGITPLWLQSTWGRA